MGVTSHSLSSDITFSLSFADQLKLIHEPQADTTLTTSDPHRCHADFTRTTVAAEAAYLYQFVSVEAEMKVIAAYLLAVLGGNTTPSADDLKDILGSVGAEADDDRIELLLSEVKGKDITELIASGREKLASVPSGGGCGVAVAATAGGGGGGGAAAAPAAETKKEEKVEEKEESDDACSHMRKYLDVKSGSGH
ncbi:hypothetical protein L1049_011150 [Liquidambar formosana]|uniref:60S acidic ribosomal protein P2 n=1 Tax=Liquidambar formosana TaxID=63359 RepID=A0AAP0X2G6_LIQFO